MCLSFSWQHASVCKKFWTSSHLFADLIRREFSDEEVIGIMGANFLWIMGKTEDVASEFSYLSSYDWTIEALYMILYLINYTNAVNLLFLVLSFQECLFRLFRNVFFVSTNALVAKITLIRSIQASKKFHSFGLCIEEILGKANFRQRNSKWLEQSSKR